MARQSIKRLSVADVEFTAFSLAKELLEFGEPIPPFSTRYPSVLESCVATPFQTYCRRSLYKGIDGKAAILFYLMTKNHPFQNGNKRIAITTLLLFLFRNRRWIDTKNKDLYEFAKYVAGSDPKDKDKVIDDIETFIRKGSVKVDEIKH